MLATPPDAEVIRNGHGARDSTFFASITVQQDGNGSTSTRARAIAPPCARTRRSWRRTMIEESAIEFENEEEIVDEFKKFLDDAPDEFALGEDQPPSRPA